MWCVVVCCVVLCCGVVVLLCCCVVVLLCCVVLWCVVMWCDVMCCGVVWCGVVWCVVVVMWCVVLCCVLCFVCCVLCVVCCVLCVVCGVWCGVVWSILKSVPDLNKLSSLVMVTLIFAYFWDSLMASIKHSFSLKILPTWLLPHVWWLTTFMQLHLGVLFPDVELKARVFSDCKRSVITLWNSSELFSSAVFSHRTPLSVLIVQHRK